MRLCRVRTDPGELKSAFYDEDWFVPVSSAAQATGIDIPDDDCLISLLPGGPRNDTRRQIQQQLLALSETELRSLQQPIDSAALQLPVPNPSKLMLLAGNYAEHIEEGGGRAEERARTFPYVFMKPPGTTLTHPNDPVVIPSVSPDHIDWELELGIVIGRDCRHVDEGDALSYVAGYTVVNDISDRQFKPNPSRAERPKDGFFDWLHGKWHDTFCPMGPCVVPADEVPDPQTLKMTLRVNGNVEQDGSTGQMIFPVAAIVAFISNIVTLRPGDVISTGTPSGVGAAKQKFLKPGDQLEAEIEHIGVLRNPVVSAD